MLKNRFVLSPSHATIHLIGKAGGKAYVDAADLPTVQAFSTRWRMNHGQAVCSLPGSKQSLQRLIMQPAADEIVQAIDGDLLNCRRGNLIVVKVARNTGPRTPGVYFETGAGKWRASATKDGKRYQLGKFLTREEAIAAREAFLGPDWGIYAELDKFKNPGAHGGRPYRVRAKHGKWVRCATIEEARAVRDGNATPAPKRVTGIYQEGKKWRAQHNGKCLGRYPSRKEAEIAKAYYLSTGKHPKGRTTKKRDRAKMSG